MLRSTTIGTSTLVQRRLALAFKTRRGVLVPLTTPILFALVIAPALHEALGGFNPSVDYMTYVAVASAVLLIPLTAMLNGLSVITDLKFGITRANCWRRRSRGRRSRWRTRWRSGPWRCSKRRCCSRWRTRGGRISTRRRRGCCGCSGR